MHLIGRWLAYRDAWRLFLSFVAEHQHTKVAAIRLDHLNRAEVLAFLQHIERKDAGGVNRHAELSTGCPAQLLRLRCRI